MTITLGDGRPAAVTLGDGRPVFSSTALGPVAFTTTGATFAPTVELASGSTAEVTWQSAAGVTLATGVTPTINFGTAAPRTVRMACTVPGDITTINLGFDNTQDAGRDGPGAGYNKAAQAVTGVSGLAALTGLRRFLAATTQLTGHLDLTGLAALEYVECFQARLTSITLTGCTSLIRICLEANRLTQLDLNPVVGSLRDLRAAVQTSAALDFVPLTAALTHVWHFCIRDQPVTRMPQHARLPAVEQHWAWNTNQSTSDSPVSAGLNSYLSDGNHYDQASVDRILTGLVAVTSGGGSVNLAGSAAPSSTGLAAAATLRGRGWAVTHA